jgi:hypothetical protein
MAGIRGHVLQMTDKNLNVIWDFLSGQKTEHRCRHGFQVDFAGCGRQHIDYLFMRNGDDTLIVNLDDSVPNSNSTAFCYSTSEQRANDAVLDAEA